MHEQSGSSDFIGGGLRPKRWWVLLALCGASLASAQTLPNATVHGSIHTVVSSAQTRVFLPDITVTLRNPSTNAIMATSRTDLTGHFVFGKQPAGQYKLCWAASGYVATCRTALVSVSGVPVYLGAQAISTSGRAISGTVKFKNGSPCFGLDPFFGLNLSTRIQVLSPAGSLLVPQVRANSQGHYVVGGIPTVTGTPNLKSLCEAVTSMNPVTSAVLSGTPLHVTLNNTPPRLDAVFANLSGLGVRTVSPGTTVDAQAEAYDPEGDGLHYLWRVETGSGTAGAADAPTVPWTLPSQRAQPSLYVLVYDGKGGYAKGRVTLTVGTEGAEFSGRVLHATSRGPVAGASVVVNGTGSTVTDASGYFSVRGVRYSSRYVVNITRQGFAELSRIYDESNRGGTYSLIPAQVGSFDPNKIIDVVDQREEMKRRQLLGARLVLQPGTLNTTGQVTGSLATVVPSLEAMPGDYGAVDGAGRGQSLISYGAVFAEFRDSKGNLVNIASGKSATMMFPLNPSQRENPPSSIPLWTYDMSRGQWIEEGFAKLETVDGNLMYVGEVSHFSTHNADLAFGGSANCLRVRVDPTKLPAGLTLRAEVPTGPASTQVIDLTLNSDQFHGLFRLPQSATITLKLLDTALNPIPGAQQIVNMAARPQLAGSDSLSLPYPYAACGQPVLLGLTMPAYAEQSQGLPYFLTGPYGSFVPPGGFDPNVVADKYYKAIDPDDLRDTLGKFWDENGFDPLTGAGGTRAAYTNHNDLGLGRDMHCLKDNVTNNVACYVTNYGFPDQNPANAAAALAAAGGVATVAMEFSPIEHALPPNATTKVVKFYVYTGSDVNAPRRPDAVLDAFGPKYVPYLCTVCHGGTYVPADPLAPGFDEVNMGSVFREFDLLSFRFPPAGTAYPPTVPDGQGSLNDFRALNDMVKGTLPAGQAVWNIIDTWYPGASATPDFATPVPGWTGSPQDGLYLNVVAPACRTCHAARAGLDFGSYANFHPFRTPIKNIVCGTTDPNESNSRRMPNAVITYKNFWESLPSQPGFLTTYADPVVGWGAFGTCP